MLKGLIAELPCNILKNDEASTNILSRTFYEKYKNNLLSKEQIQAYPILHLRKKKTDVK